MNYQDISKVFGVKEDPVSSIIHRHELIENIKECTIDFKHMIIYGGSKQGKSTLFTHCFDEDEYITIRCGDFKSIETLYTLILDKAGVEITVGETTENTSSINGGATAKGQMSFLKIFSAGAEAQVNSTFGDKTSCTYQTRYSDLSIAQNVIEILKDIGFNKIIRLENFHYLSDDIQSIFATDIRTFSEYKITFIILGVWTQQDSILLKNLDLNGRMQSLTVEPWSKEEFKAIINKGSSELNVTFSEGIINKIIENSFGNVGLLQDICKHSISSNMKNTKDWTINTSDFNYAISKIKEQEHHRINQFFQLLLEVNRSSDRLYIPYLFCKCLTCISPADLSSGIDIKEVLKRIKDTRRNFNQYNDTSIMLDDLIIYLEKIISKQKEDEMKTPLIDFNKANIGSEISVIDKYFLFSLHHMSEQEFDTLIPTPRNFVLEPTNIQLDSDKNDINNDKLKLAYIEIERLNEQLGEKELTESIDLINNPNDYTSVDYEEPTKEELKNIKNHSYFETDLIFESSQIINGFFTEEKSYICPCNEGEYTWIKETPIDSRNSPIFYDTIWSCNDCSKKYNIHKSNGLLILKS